MQKKIKQLQRAPVTLKDIAEGLQLSVMAVSKALRGHLDIGAETRRRVMQRAAELGYRPNLLPRQMLSIAAAITLQ